MPGLYLPVAQRLFSDHDEVGRVAQRDLCDRVGFDDLHPQCLENPRPKGGTFTLPENASSPVHAEPCMTPSALSTFFLGCLSEKRAHESDRVARPGSRAP
jgi:hypothetical protein